MLIDRKTMPKGWKSPFRVDLYQVVVDQTNGKGPLVVGPAILKDDADRFCEAIKLNIKAGAERQWSNPTVLQVKAAAQQLVS